jgi:hypothetical protein
MRKSTAACAWVVMPCPTQLLAWGGQKAYAAVWLGLAGIRCRGAESTKGALPHPVRRLPVPTCSCRALSIRTAWLRPQLENGSVATTAACTRTVNGSGSGRHPAIMLCGAGRAAWSGGGGHNCMQQASTLLSAPVRSLPHTPADIKYTQCLLRALSAPYRAPSSPR